MSTRLRQATLNLHRWAGLTLGPLVVFMAVTGAMLVFREPQWPWRAGATAHGQPCPAPQTLDALAATARRQHPGAAITQIRISQRGKPVLVGFDDGDALPLDLCSGALVARQNHGQADGFSRIEQWHRLRFLGDKPLASTVAGAVAALVLLVFVLAGWMIWWPARVLGWRQHLGLPMALTGRAFEVNLHRTTGRYVSLALGLLALSGLPMAFKPLHGALVAWAPTPPAPPAPHSRQPTVAAPAVALQTLWRQAQPWLEAPSKTVLHLPRSADGAVEVQMLGRDAAGPGAQVHVYLDAYSGAVLRVDTEGGRGQRLVAWLVALHKGELGGLLGQWLLLLGAAGTPVLAVTGIHSYLRRRWGLVPAVGEIAVRVAAIRELAPDLKTYDLVRSDGKPLPAFTPGAHINLHIDHGLLRQYALCGSLHDLTRYRILVQRAPVSSGGSLALHERVAVGDRLSIGRPRNLFPLVPRAAHHLLVAGGVGIAPMLSMVAQLQRSGASFALHHFARSALHLGLLQQLGEPPVPRAFTPHQGLSPAQTLSALQQLLHAPAAGSRLYLCGPAPFMAAAQAAARAAGWPAEAIQSAHFGAEPAADQAARLHDKPGDSHAFEVALARRGVVHLVPAGQSILQVLRRHGLAVPCACEHGVCGSCATGVLGGTPDHRDRFLNDRERDSDHCMMLCVSRARSPRIVLDL